jgi:hypothetical protein
MVAHRAGGRTNSAAADKTPAVAPATKERERSEKAKRKSQSLNGSSGAGESSPKRARREPVDDAAADARAEAEQLLEAVDTQGADPTPPPSPPRATAADRAKALEFNKMKEAADKAAAELARVTKELENEKRKNMVTKDPVHQPAQGRKTPKKSAAGCRKEKVPDIDYA